MRVLPWQARRVGLVLTTLPGLKESVIAGTVAAMEARVTGLGGTLLPPLQCPHQTAPVAAALERLLADGADLLLVAGASAVGGPARRGAGRDRGGRRRGLAFRHAGRPG